MKTPSDYLPEPTKTTLCPASAELSEFDYANLLAQTLPPIKTCGHDWFTYQSGVWRQITRDELRPAAQGILPAIVRTARKEAAVLDHLEGRSQVSPDAFQGFNRFDDSGAVLINASNCVVRVDPNGDVSTLPHEEEHLFRGQAAASYDPTATANLFLNVLEQSLPDPADRELLQLCCGNFLFPDCRYEAALICFGEAGRGKSTIADPIAAALGPGLVQRLSMMHICDHRSYHLPKLRYAAVNLGTELDSLAVDESANFKTIVSGEPIEARPIYGNPFTMTSSCKLWFLANGLPRFKNGTEAELRRMRFLHFNQQPAHKDVTLKSRLLAERDGVFKFMIEGLQKLIQLPEIHFGGEESRRVHARFRISNDPIGVFAEDYCEFNPEHSVSKETLFEAFKDFREEHSLSEAMDGVWFLKRLYERYTQLKPTRVRRGQERVNAVAGLILKSRGVLL